MFVQTSVYGTGASNDHFRLQLLHSSTRAAGILCEKGWYGFILKYKEISGFLKIFLKDTLSILLSPLCFYLFLMDAYGVYIPFLTCLTLHFIYND